MEPHARSVFTDRKYEYYLPNEWKAKASEELNENPATVRQEIAIFREKVKNIKGLHSRLDDCFLLSFLRARKFNQDKALKTLKKFYEFREAYSDYFQPMLVTENKELYYDKGMFKVLQQKDSLGRTVAILRIGKVDFSTISMDETWRVIFGNLDSLLLDQTFQVGGLVVVMDCSNVGLSHLKQITFKFIKIFCHVLLDTYPIRFKAFHALNTPVYFHAIVKIVKPFLSKKIVDRLFFHGSDMKNFDSHIKANTLPVAYGGTQSGFDNDWWLKEMEDMEEALMEHATRYGTKKTIGST